MRRKGQTSWNGEPTFFNIKSWVLRAPRIARKLEKIDHAIGPVATREDLALFLGIPKNAQKVNSLVEDIRDALMDYQVCPPKGLALLIADIYSGFVATRHRQRKLSTDRESYCPMTLASVVTRK